MRRASSSTGMLRARSRWPEANSARERTSINAAPEETSARAEAPAMAPRRLPSMSNAMPTAPATIIQSVGDMVMESLGEGKRFTAESNWLAAGSRQQHCIISTSEEAPNEKAGNETRVRARV